MIGRPSRRRRRRTAAPNPPPLLPPPPAPPPPAPAEKGDPAGGPAPRSVPRDSRKYHRDIRWRDTGPAPGRAEAGCRRGSADPRRSVCRTGPSGAVRGCTGSPGSGKQRREGVSGGARLVSSGYGNSVR